ncbi:MAG: hypothetical protein ACRCVJ_11685 [Clostridium sp.]|uniref:hypothetical protein n=1 Tax=Clostridium sp. TaxID=1506 RepID=UPI003F2C524E
MKLNQIENIKRINNYIILKCSGKKHCVYKNIIEESKDILKQYNEVEFTDIAEVQRLIDHTTVLYIRYRYMSETEERIEKGWRNMILEIQNRVSQRI